MSETPSPSDSFASQISPDGKTATITITKSGKAVTFDLPTERLPHLMLFASETASKAIRIRDGNPAAVHIIPIAEWRCIPHPDGNNAVLQFRIEGGPEASFRLGLGRVPAMIAALKKLLGAPQPSKAKH